MPVLRGAESNDGLELGRENDKIHPTQKPVQVSEIPIANHTKPGEAVIDPFLGSGSTLIACGENPAPVLRHGDRAALRRRDTRPLGEVQWQAGVSRRVVQEGGEKGCLNDTKTQGKRAGSAVGKAGFARITRR
jgi:hypothetical protein